VPCWCQVDFDIVRHHGSSGEVRVHYTTSPGTARPSPHRRALYVPVSGWLVFTDGALGHHTVSVMLMDNGVLEGPQTFFVNITRLELIEPRYAHMRLFSWVCITVKIGRNKDDVKSNK